MTRTGPTNRLAGESSPYLLLHSRNPVDWYPWGAEAIAKARAEDKPIFLSVGYSTCYWCHVMERESFSDPGVAEEMNRHFVSVKVDREERPDLDEVYMLATQILAGQGGWPNSVFLTPQLEPFFAGTYFPPRDAHGRPGFPTVLRSLVHAWEERRGEVEEQAAELGAAIRRHLDEIEPAAGVLPGGELALSSLAGLRQRFDPTWGGFGQQPKFPTPSNLWLLFALLDGTVRTDAAGTVDTPSPSADTRGAERPVSSESPRPVSSESPRPVSSESPRPVSSESLRPISSMMLDSTLDAMARGGIFDQLAGGFHRYATDREWRVPHFEKMLYDNGLLLELYARQHARTGRTEPARVALATADWLEREMTSPEGAFWSAIDAETDGHEGAYYVWTRGELDAALGAEDADFLAPLYGFADEPFFEGEAYVLHLPRPLEVQAAARRTTPEALLAEIAPLAAKLLEARGRRERPATDDKILTDWNGAAIAGLAVAGEALARPDLVVRAARAAEMVLGSLRAPDGTLLHAWRGGTGRIAAFLSDYVFFIRGLLRLHAASGERRWLDEARRLQEEQERRLASPRGGYFNAAEADDLLIRGKELFDGAMPAANGVAALNLVELHSSTGDSAYLEAAERTLRAFAPIVETHPDGARTLCIAFAAFETTAKALSEGEGSQARTSAPKGSSAAHGSGATMVGEASGGAAAAGSGAASDPALPSMKSLSLAGIAAIEPPVVTLGEADADGWRPFVLRFTVRSGWHLAVDAGLPTLAGAGASLQRIEWPTGRPLGADGPGDPKLPVFEGAVEVRGRLRREAPRASLELRFVACGEGRCLPPAEVEVPVP